MYKFFRPLIFHLDPESAHNLVLNILRLVGMLPPSRWLLQAVFAAPDKPVHVLGLTFCNPVGLAAGYDKGAVALPGLAALGFGHIEIGTVTPRPQPGNPRPRVFRLVEDEAIINRMGFPGRGAHPIIATLCADRKRHSRGLAPIIGVNLGKNKDTPLDNAADDYALLLRAFTPWADYLAINISSPNTAGLRRLQGRGLLTGLLQAIARERDEITLGRGGHAPVLVKLSPDLDDSELDDALDIILQTGMDGVIVTNTTLARQDLTSALRLEVGGLSGRPLTLPAEALLKKVVHRLAGRLPVISVGGIMSPDDAMRRLEMGAVLVQIYTGLIYAGPDLVRQIIRAL